MRGYAHVVIIGRAGAAKPHGFVVNALLPDGDRFIRFPFSVVVPIDVHVKSGDWVLVSGQLGNEGRIVAREIVLLAGDTSVGADPRNRSARFRHGAYEAQQIALDGYWQARRGMPVWVRRHAKTVRKKVT